MKETSEILGTIRQQRDECSSHVYEFIERYDWEWLRCADCGHVEPLGES